MKPILALVLVLSFLLGCAPAPKKKGTKPILLRLKYSKGDIYNITYHNYTQEENNDIPNNLDVKMTFTVDAVTRDSVFLISSKFDHLKSKGIFENSASDASSVNRSGAKVDFKKMAYDNFNPIVDSTLKLIINSRGQVIKPFYLAGGQEFNKSFAPLLYEDCQIIFPVHAIVTGEEWTNERNFPAINTKQITTYFIEEIKNSIIEINVAGRIENAGHPESRRANKFYGHYSIDERSKKLISAKITMDVQLLLTNGKQIIVIEAQNKVDYLIE